MFLFTDWNFGLFSGALYSLENTVFKSKWANSSNSKYYKIICWPDINKSHINIISSQFSKSAEIYS